MASLDDIKTLREQTGAGFTAVKEALDQSGGNFDEAMKILRLKGMAKADKRQSKVAAYGVIGTYIHTNNRLVTLVEVSCETDFAANSSDLLKFANELALQVAATNPEYLNESSIPADLMKKNKEIFAEDLSDKPEAVREGIVAGRVNKFYEEKVLTHQKFFTDESKTITDILNEVVVKIGEKITITRFVRTEVNADFKIFN